MSFVDAVCVGQCATTVELAALGPNLVIFNFINFTFQFLAIATTISTVAALSKSDKAKASRVVSSALQIALQCGLAVTCILVGWGGPALSATGAVPEMLAAAKCYLDIRLWASPAVLATLVLQSGLLAQKDSFTCFLAVMGAAAFNIVGDLVLILVFKMGIAGAAWATVAGNYLGLAILLFIGYGRKDSSISLNILTPPRYEELKAFGKAMGPLFFLSTSKNICYLMIQSVSTTFSTLTCAAHQAMWSAWAIFSFCPTPLEQCAQVFLPRHVAADYTMSKDERADWNEKRDPSMVFKRSREFVKSLFSVGLGLGLLLGTIAASTQFYPFLFTKDQALWPIMQTFWPYMMFSLTCAGVCIAFDGVLLALGDVNFLWKCQVVNVIALWAFLYLFVMQSGIGIIGVWQGVILFFGLRTLQNALRIAGPNGILPLSKSWPQWAPKDFKSVGDPDRK